MDSSTRAIRGAAARFLPRLASGTGSTSPQIPDDASRPLTNSWEGTASTIDHRGGAVPRVGRRLEYHGLRPAGVYLHAELEGMLLRASFESLIKKWRAAGASIVDMAAVHAQVTKKPLPVRSVVSGEISGARARSRAGSEGAARAPR